MQGRVEARPLHGFRTNSRDPTTWRPPSLHPLDSCHPADALGGMKCIAAFQFWLDGSGTSCGMMVISPIDLGGSEPISIVLPTSPEDRIECNVAKDWSCHAVSLGVTQLSPWWDACWHLSGWIMARFPTCPGELWVCQETRGLVTFCNMAFKTKRSELRQNKAN